MAWLSLFAAGLFEIGWAIGLKYTVGFTRLVPTALTLLSMILSIWLLGLALKTLPVGTAYPIWTGIGSIGTVVRRIVLLGESASATSWPALDSLCLESSVLKLCRPSRDSLGRSTGAGRKSRHHGEAAQALQRSPAVGSPLIISIQKKAPA